jgi:hypothetical protein
LTRETAARKFARIMVWLSTRQDGLLFFGAGAAISALGNIDIAVPYVRRARVDGGLACATPLETNRRPEQDNYPSPGTRDRRRHIGEVHQRGTSSCQIFGTKWKWLRSKARPRDVARRQNPTNDLSPQKLTTMRRRSASLCSIDPGRIQRHRICVPYERDRPAIASIPISHRHEED